MRIWWKSASRATHLGLALLLLIVLLGDYAVAKGLLVSKSAVSAYRTLQQLQALSDSDPLALVQGGGLADVSRQVRGLHGDLQRIQRYIGGDLTLAAHLSWLPLVGPLLGAAPQLLEIGVQLSAAGEAALEGGQPLLDDLFSGRQDAPSAADASLTERVLAALMGQQPAWARAQVAAQQAAQARARLDVHGLPSRLVVLISTLDSYLPWLEAGTTSLVLAPELMGASGPRRYLILAENNDELRATGGYISGVGLLTLDKGRIAGLQFDDAYAVDNLDVDHPDPPAAMHEQMGIDLWLIKDTNWFPNFPDSAKACLDIYYNDQGISADGVIAADMVALQRIVAAVGPLQLAAYDTTIDGSNVLAMIQSYWAPDLPEGMTWEEWEAIPWAVRKSTWFDTRKSFMPDLVKALQDRVLGDPASLDLKALLLAIKHLFDEKHAVIYLPDPRAEAMLATLGWDGAMGQPKQDYLAVVDTNVGYTKANPNISEKVVYHVQIDEQGQAQADLSLTYKNTSTRQIDVCVKDMRYEPTYELMTQRCYWDYVRVYAPGSSTLVSSESDARVDSLDEGIGLSIWATSFVIAPGEGHQLGFSYVLPDGTVEKGKGDEWTYRLTLQKQAGTDAVPVQVTVQLPPGAKVVKSAPRPASVEGSLLKYNTNLSLDRDLEIVFTH